MRNRLPNRITATQLRDLDTCERRYHLDLVGDPAKRDPVGGFVQMLWAGGVQHEDRVLERLAEGAADLRPLPTSSRMQATLKAVEARAPIILGGAIGHADLMGMPDLMRLGADGYVAGDVKNGAAIEASAATARLKRSYGVQLAHYASVLSRLDWGPAGRATIIDGDGVESEHDLDAPISRDGLTTRSHHASLSGKARLIRNGAITTSPAASADCAQCHWRTYCRAELEQLQDATLVPEVGRALRTRLGPALGTLPAIATVDLSAHTDRAGRSTIRGVSIDRLGRFKDRATLLTTANAQPFARRTLGLPVHSHEIHYDVESDPMRGGLVYLHGFLERIRHGDEVEIRVTSFFADDPADERDAFEAAWRFLADRPDGHIYVWSRFERTSMRALQRRHDGVCSPSDVEALFETDRCTDLYTDVVAPHTEWPLTGYGLKKVARHIGFEWRDDDPSGANSIAWFAEWLETRDPAIRTRIIRYNEDDVAATAAVLDRLRTLSVRL